MVWSGGAQGSLSTGKGGKGERGKGEGGVVIMSGWTATYATLEAI